MKRLLVLLICLTAFLAGCAKPGVSTAVIEVRQTYQECPEPDWPPVWPFKLDPTSPMGGAKNQEATAHNINYAVWYMETQKAVIDCYKGQTKHQ